MCLMVLFLPYFILLPFTLGPFPLLLFNVGSELIQQVTYQAPHRC